MRHSSLQVCCSSVDVSSGGWGSRLGKVGGGGAQGERGEGGVEADIVSGIS